jgi:hypothetical protein
MGNLILVTFSTATIILFKIDSLDRFIFLSLMNLKKSAIASNCTAYKKVKLDRQIQHNFEFKTRSK